MSGPGDIQFEFDAMAMFQSTDESVIRVIGTTVAGDVARTLVDDADVVGKTLVGWIRVELIDLAGRITDGHYHIPVYELSLAADFILQENLDKILQENLDGILQE